MSDIRELENELRHARVYDPVKAHEYYMRTRKLKGRRRGRSQPTGGSHSSSGGYTIQGGTGGSSNADLRDSRREELEANIEKMRAQVDRLRELIRIRVKAAKKRAGVDVEKEEEKKSSSSSSKTKKDSKDSKSSKDKPLTEKEKREKRKASKEQYEKENKTSLAREAQALRNTIKDLRERLAKLQKEESKSRNAGGTRDSGSKWKDSDRPKKPKKPGNQGQNQSDGGNGR